MALPPGEQSRSSEERGNPSDALTFSAAEARARAEIERYRRDRGRARVFGRLLSLVALGFLGWLVVEIMVRGRLDLASIVLQVLMILTGAVRVVLSYWDQVPALVYGLRDGTPEVQAACRAAWERLEGAPGHRLWELSPTGRPEDRPTADEAVALLVASQRTDWRRVAPVCFWVYSLLVVAGVSWFVTYEPAPEFDGYASTSQAVSAGGGRAGPRR